MQCFKRSRNAVAMEVFDVHTTLSMREFDMFSQVHFNQQPFEFVYMNISKRFAKIPFS